MGIIEKLENDIRLIIAYAAAAAIIAFFIIFYKNNKKRIEFVQSTSKKYKAVILLNKDYIFDEIPSPVSIYKECNSKQQFDHINLREYLVTYLSDNPGIMYPLFIKVNRNKSLYQRYAYEYLKIMSMMTEYEKRIYADHGYYQELETSLCKKIEKCPVISIEIAVTKHYSSPSGRNSYRECVTFDENQVNKCIDEAKNRVQYKESARYERAKMSAGLRFEVLKRDGYRCVICGASRATGAILHVDHIIPVSKGGKTVMSNLQTLCEQCNLGKSNKSM